ncbi:hypothetical protein H5410_061778 [Solanum commersonii]|uniref:Putative plant transposon protein domain-containing protein n=1 Tax=Solanum commersonii TaxID=4109 RepID=A0A9J5W9T8_SOLCO|nr:hypothetical protein H5410_061778 [Solanum commersonii]
MVNNKRKMAPLITEKAESSLGACTFIPDIHRYIAHLHKCDWMARDPRMYSNEIVREFYASYAATLRDVEHAEWVAAPQLGIRKATLTFVAKFFWLLVRNRVYAGQSDNQVRVGRAVMVAALVAGVEIDFARMLLAEIHERAVRTSTTYPFPCLIFHLCRDFGVSIWHCDKLVHPIGALDIDLIQDEANVVAPRREP